MRRSHHWITLAAVLAVTACDDPFRPQMWDGSPVSVTLYSASRAEYTGLVSALDLVAPQVRGVSIEAPGALGNWDVVLLEGPTGLVLSSATVFEGAPSGGRIAMLPNRTFLEVTEAPQDTAAYSAGPVPVRTDAVYVIRSRRASCGYSAGVRYAKVQPIEVDPVRGIFRFVVSRNPFCEDRSLVPPTE